MPTSLSRLPAIVVLLAATTSASASVNVSIFSRLQEIADPFLDRIGVDFDLQELNVDLPPRAAEAVNRAFGRVESALDGALDRLDNSGVIDRVLDGGLLDDGNLGDLLDDLDLPNLDIPNIDIPDIDLPEVNIPNVDQIVQDALDRAEAARASARQRAQSAIDDALGRAENILGDLELPTIPQIDIPQVDVPNVQQIIDDALSGAGDILDDIDVDLPDVQSIVDDALGRADGILDDVLDDVNGADVGGIVEDALDRAEDAIRDATGAIEEVLDRDPLNDVLNNLPEDLIPSSVFTTLETIFNRVDGVMLSQQAAVSVPEPTSGVLLMLAGVLGVARRRR